MRYRKFGNTDLEVSEICFGPMRFANESGTVDDASNEGMRALHRGLDLGVNFIHSSYEYGTRWAIGSALCQRSDRDRLLHVIKVPVPDWEDKGGFDPAKFRLRIEEALSEMGVERIDLLQYMTREQPNTDETRIPILHNVIDDVCAEFERLRDEGKVGYLACFPYTTGFARAAIDTGRFAGIVAYYNAVEMEMADFFEELRARGMGFLCIRPYLAGLLTDKRRNWDTLPEGDRMKQEEKRPWFDRKAAIEKLLGDKVRSWTEFAIKFVLSEPLVASVVVGINTVEQAEQVCALSDGDYPYRDVIAPLLDLYRREGPVT